MKKKNPAAYVVTRGRAPGIYYSWERCHAQVNGFKDSYQEGYDTIEDAEAAWESHLKKQGNIDLDESDDTLEEDSDEDNDNNRNTQESSPPEPGPNHKRFHTEFDDECLDDFENNLPNAKRRLFSRTSADQVESLYDEPPMLLTADQQAVIDNVLDPKNGRNVFLTGAGGCGKTVTLKHLLARLQDEKVTYQVVAPTGIATLPLKGKTTYSFLGWTQDSEHKSLDELQRSISESTRENVTRTEIIIIEEISMVSSFFLERMNRVIQAIMNNHRPFGGKKVVLLGDFHQLAPVQPFKHCFWCGLFMNLKHTIRCDNCWGTFTDADKWAFKAPVWNALDLKNVQLRQIHRQKDTSFQDVLNKLRLGIKLTDLVWTSLEAERPLPAGAFVVNLMARSAEVDQINESELGRLATEPGRWRAEDHHYMINPEQKHMKPWLIEDPLRHHPFPPCLDLKRGAKVVLLTNLDERGGLVNGSQGTVVGFSKLRSSNEYELLEGSVPQSQFEKTNEDDKLKYLALDAPIVRFADGSQRPIHPVSSMSKVGTNVVPYLAQRIQIPLTLAWAHYT